MAPNDDGGLTHGSVCDICMSAPRAVRFHPCGHSIACELCTLQLIAKCPGSSEAESLLCPHCKAPITQIEKDRPGAPIPLRRQNTFVPSAFDPLSVVGHVMTVEGAAATSGVLEFIDSLKDSTDKETQAAAEAASKAWATGTAELQLQPAQLQLAQLQLRMQQQARVPPHPAVRAISGVLALSYLCVFVWGILAILPIRTDFGTPLHSDRLLSLTLTLTQILSFTLTLNLSLTPTLNLTLSLTLP